MKPLTIDCFQSPYAWAHCTSGGVIPEGRALPVSLFVSEILKKNGRSLSSKVVFK